jgi:hypothetical protein
MTPRAQVNRAAQNLGILSTIGGLILESTHQSVFDYIESLF